MAKPFNFVQDRILLKTAKALFDGRPMSITPRQVVDNLQDMFGQIHGNKPQEIALSLHALAAVLGPFYILSTTKTIKRRIAKRLQKAENQHIEDLARLRGIVYAGYYGHWLPGDEDENEHNPVHASLGYVLPKFRNPARDPANGELKVPPINPMPNRDLPDSVFESQNAPPTQADVIVIGSGAGGGTAAANLASEHQVLIVEAGRHHPSHDIGHEEKRMTATLFVDGGIQTTKDRDIVVFQGRCVGGSTVLNNGICLRVKEPGKVHAAAPNVLAQWAQLGAAVAPATLDQAYHDVDIAVGIDPVAPRSGRNNGPHLRNGWANYIASTGDPHDIASPNLWFEKNWGKQGSPLECVYCGYCNTGCPYGRKNAMPQGRLRDATAAGAKILCEAKALRIRWKDDEIDGKRVAEGVVVRLTNGREHFIRATKGVVVAAGAIASSRLLRNSDIDNAGKGLSLSIACPVAALMPTERRSWDEDQMTTYVDCGDFLLESHFQPPMSMATIVPGWFEEHYDRMQNYNRLASAGILFPADRRGKLEDGKLDFKLRDDVEKPLLRRALAVLIKVHFEAGAIEVYPGLSRGQVVTREMFDTPGAIEAFLEENIRETDDAVLSSSHPQGGNAIGADPQTSVVGMDFKVHGTDNVVVADASLFPSCIRVNAQFTTMAMAHLATAGHPFP